MEKPYRQDMSHTTWDRVYENQRKRAGLLKEWLDALRLQPGGRLLDIGCGPGYASLEAARRVGETGRVYAVDRSAEALAYLAERQKEQGVTQIERIHADATELKAPAEPVDAALMSMMLHHVDDQARLLAAVAAVLPAGARAVVAEFHPEGPCDIGPPRDVRVAPEQAEAWAAAAGLSRIDYRRQSPEHYMLLLERT